MRQPLCQPLHSLGRHHCEPFCTRLGKNVTTFRHLFRGRNTRHSLKTKVAPFQKAATLFFLISYNPFYLFRSRWICPCHVYIYAPYARNIQHSICLASAGRILLQGGDRSRIYCGFLKKKIYKYLGQPKPVLLIFFIF